MFGMEVPSKRTGLLQLDGHYSGGESTGLIRRMGQPSAEIRGHTSVSSTGSAGQFAAGERRGIKTAVRKQQNAFFVGEQYLPRSPGGQELCGLMRILQSG